EQFARAFRAWDKSMDLDRDPTEVVAARLGGQPPPVVEQVVAGLEAWLGYRRRRGDAAGCRRPLAPADRLDGDEGTRQGRAVGAGGGRAGGRAGAALTSVLLPFSAFGEEYRGPARRRLEQRAEARAAARQPVLGVLALARALAEAGDNVGAERLLRRALAV